MKLTATEILKHLGFAIPEDGIEISENDAYLMTSALQIAGQSIDFDRVDDAKIEAVHRGMAGIVSGWSQSGLVAPTAVKDKADSESLLKLRATLAIVLKVTFRRQAS